jgi:hypothetical protein
VMPGRHTIRPFVIGSLRLARRLISEAKGF